MLLIFINNNNFIHVWEQIYILIETNLDIDKIISHCTLYLPKEQLTHFCFTLLIFIAFHPIILFDIFGSDSCKIYSLKLGIVFIRQWCCGKKVKVSYVSLTFVHVKMQQEPRRSTLGKISWNFRLNRTFHSLSEAILIPQQNIYYFYCLLVM